MPPKLKKFLPLIIGGVLALVVFLLIISGAGENLIKGIFGLLGIGAAAKAGHTITKSRKAITESTEEHAETTEALNERQADRAEADTQAVEEAAADPGPDTTVPDDDERERKRAEMERVKMGRRKATPGKKTPKKKA